MHNVYKVNCIKMAWGEFTFENVKKRVQYYFAICDLDLLTSVGEVL